MCSYKNKDIIGIQGGYAGILNGHMQQLFPRDLGNVIQRGGTFLKTGRYLDFHKPEVRAQAAEILRKNQIDFLIVIGGDGSFQGAHLLWEEQKIPVIGIPGTIDNDIFGTDLSIGFDTAVNTALEAIDKIRDTADSHDRIFIVEVMGRNSGFIASSVGIGRRGDRGHSRLPHRGNIGRSELSLARILWIRPGKLHRHGRGRFDRG
jgi:6-phosphofructokinase 1